MIAVLGTGLLGSGFARALCAKGHAVRVWNRTAAKAQALAAAGATVAADPVEAVRGAERVHLVLSDDAAVDAVLESAAPGLAPAALLVDHTTTSTAGARARTAGWRARGRTYVHAPVFMGPQNAAESTGLMLVSGEREVVARVTPLLAPLTGELIDLGPRVDAAAAFKLLGNLLLIALSGGLTDLLALGRAMGVAPAQVAGLLEHFNPGSSLPARLQRILAADYDHPSWELAMARKDARLMQAEADGAGIALTVLPAVAALMDRRLAQGLGHADWTVIARDVVEDPRA
jgi:3-hydroxyisobutyrate dehydrogenase